MLAVFSCATDVFSKDSLDKIRVLPFLLAFCIPACSYLPCLGPSCISCISCILSLELDGLMQSTALIAVLQSDLIFYFILVPSSLSM